MDKAMKSFKLLRLPWDHEKLEKVIDIEEVKYKTYFIQVWLTGMFLITLSFIVWCCFYVWKVEGHLRPGLFNPKIQCQTFQPQTFQP